MRIKSITSRAGRAAAGLMLGVGLIGTATISVWSDDHVYQDQIRPCSRGCSLQHSHRSAPGVGTLGYGPPGPHPGFQGFGLGYHKGYGYGGAALGPGAEGGYPLYGGPGYPHPWPTLRRIGGINPFPYYGGPGGPTPTCPQYFGGVGPLVQDKPVVTIIGGNENESYGGFSGMVPYPPETFATGTAAAAGETSQPADASPR
ncbi:hypothetical protein [Paludisphaera rhizosphaerae]|uniref:hypothetical protein n=1 Tax=Paludisphaera rhizosphaerae TaxID=2711216 RepID=UPI0013ECFF1D|nr:hypothetical protein [Paludisphaera rhizosphaerae]